MNKKIIFAGLSLAVFMAVVFSASAATKVTLKVEKNGKGTVTSNDGKINCGSDCKEVYSSGGSVVLTATPAEGFTFDKWTGNACLDTGYEYKDVTIGHCTVSLEGKSKTLTAKAHFKKVPSSSSSSSKSSKSSSSKSSKSSSSSKSSVSATATTPTIKVVSPNGGEVWKAGTTKNIVFKGNLMNEPVTITIFNSGSSDSEGGLASVGIIGDSVTSSNGKKSTFSWPIPTTTEQRNDYKISIRYTNNSKDPNAILYDESDKTFTIKNKANTTSSKSASSKSSKSSSSKSSKSSTTSASTYTLKINKSGKGRVSDGGRLNCGTICKETYWAGAEVKLTAVPDGGYVFEKFSPEKECSSVYPDGLGVNDKQWIKQALAYVAGENVVCVTTMNKNKTITAVFKKTSRKGVSSTK